jgi:O-antigen ligase
MPAIELQAEHPRFEHQPKNWLLESLAIVLVSILFNLLVLALGLKWLLPLFAGILSIVILVRWPNGALIGLIAASAMPRYVVAVSSWNAKAEHFVAPLIALVILIRVFWSGQRLEFRRSDYLLLAFVGMNYVGSAINSPDPKATLRWALLFTLACASYFVSTHLLSSPRLLRNAMNIFLLVGAGEALFGLLCFVSNHLFGTTLGMGYYPVLEMPAIQGSHLEPNIFGSYTASFAVMFLAYSLAKARQRSWYVLGFLVTTFACLLSLARAAWFGFLAGFLFVLWYSPARSKVRLRKLIPTFAVLLLLVLGLSLEVLPRFGYVGERLASLAHPTEAQTLLHREFYYALALEDSLAHPWIGWGSSSFALFWDYDTGEGSIPAWIGNLEVRVLHDTGIIGLALFVLFLGYLLRDVAKAFKKTRDGDILTSIGALLGGSVVLLVAFQVTEATTLAFPWVHLGLLAAAARIALAEQKLPVPGRVL